MKLKEVATLNTAQLKAVGELRQEGYKGPYRDDAGHLYMLPHFKGQDRLFVLYNGETAKPCGWCGEPFMGVDQGDGWTRCRVCGGN